MLGAFGNPNDAWLASSNPLMMPAAGTPRLAEQDAFYGGSNPYYTTDPTAYRDMLGISQRYQGTPMYQLDPTFTPSMSPEVRQLMQQKQAYDNMSEEQKQIARTTGNGYFNNAMMGDLMDRTIGSKNPLFALSSKLWDWTGKHDDAIAQAALAQDNGNRPSQMKSWAADQLANKTWAASTLGQGYHALPTGDQLGRIMKSMEHRTGPVDPELMQAANTYDYFNNLLIKNPQPISIGSGSKEGMAGGGSGSFANQSPDFYEGDNGGRGAWGTPGSGIETQLPGYKWGDYTPPSANKAPVIGMGTGLGSPFTNPLFGPNKGITATGVVGEAKPPNINGGFGQNSGSYPIPSQIVGYGTMGGTEDAGGGGGGPLIPAGPKEGSLVPPGVAQPEPWKPKNAYEQQVQNNQASKKGWQSDTTWNQNQVPAGSNPLYGGGMTQEQAALPLQDANPISKLWSDFMRATEPVAQDFQSKLNYYLANPQGQQEAINSAISLDQFMDQFQPLNVKGMVKDKLINTYQQQSQSPLWHYLQYQFPLWQQQFLQGSK